MRLRYVRYLTQCVILLDVTGFTFIALAELSIHDAMRHFSNYNILVYFNCYVCRLLLLLPDISNSMNSIFLAGSQHCIEFYEFDLSAIPNTIPPFMPMPWYVDLLVDPGLCAYGGKKKNLRKIQTFERKRGSVLYNLLPVGSGST